MKKYTGLEQIDTVIQKGICAVGKKFTKDYRCRYALFHWNEVVGEYVAKNVRTVAVENEVLLLYAPDSTWRNEIKMFQEQIVQKFNNFAGEKIIKEICFVNRPPSKKQLNYINDKKTKRNDKDKPVSLTEEEENYITKACAAVEDGKLKEQLAKLMRSHGELKHRRENMSWRKCEKCGRLCPPPYKICYDCRVAKQEE